MTYEIVLGTRYTLSEIFITERGLVVVIEPAVLSNLIAGPGVWRRHLRNIAKRTEDYCIKQSGCVPKGAWIWFEKMYINERSCAFNHSACLNPIIPNEVAEHLAKLPGFDRPPQLAAHY